MSPTEDGFWSPDTVAPMPSDDDATRILGPKCGECGHRRGLHRPPLMGGPACSLWVEGQESVYPADGE